MKITQSWTIEVNEGEKYLVKTSDDGNVTIDFQTEHTGTRYVLPKDIIKAIANLVKADLPFIPRVPPPPPDEPYERFPSPFPTWKPYEPSDGPYKQTSPEPQPYTIWCNGSAGQ